MQRAESNLFIDGGGKQLGFGILKDKPNTLTEGVIEFIVVQALFINPLPKSPDAARLRKEQTVQDPEQCRFSRSIRPQKNDPFALVDQKIQVQGCCLAVGIVKVNLLHLKHWCCGVFR